MLGPDLGTSIIIASFLLIGTLYFLMRHVLPNVLHSVALNCIDHIVTTYLPQMNAEGNEGGRPPEGLMGNPLVQRIGMLLIDKIQGSALSSNAKTYAPGLK